MALGWIDLGVLAAYFAVTIGIGLWAGRKERDTADFFLGGRRQHWLLAGMSIIATEVSAVTLIAVPAEAFRSDWSYLQMYAGSFLGRVAIAFVLLPAFYRGSVTTVYEYLGQRFGRWTRTTASLMFFASRVIGSGIRLLIASLAISVVFGWRLELVVAASAGIAIVYAAAGGIKAIMWTDAFQAILFIAAAVVAVVVIFQQTPGSWQENLHSAYSAGKFHTFTWSGGLNNDKVFWILTLNAFFTTMAALGTDQDMTQRMLTCPNLRDGQRSLLFNAVAGLPIVCVFLLIGSLLYAYGERSPLPDVGDRVFPHFIASAMPHDVGIKGLMVAAIFAAAMSSLSSAIGALATTAVNDFYRPFTRHRSEAQYLRAARAFTIVFGAILIAVAMAFAGSDELLWKIFKWVGLVFGGMLGIFLLGVTTRARGHDGWNVVAMLSSFGFLTAVMLNEGSPGEAIIAWPWWVVLGTAWTYLVAACFRRRPI